VIPALIVPFVMIGGIVSGIFTATESAAIAVVTALFVSIFLYRTFKISKLFRMLIDTGIVVGSLMFILSGATVFAWLLTAEEVPQTAVKYITMVSANPFINLLLINLFLLVVGTFMDPTPSMLILAPILLPVALQMGLNPVQFGVVITLNLVIGLTTPPVGGCLFVASAISGVSIERISRAIWPFVLANILVLILVTYIPWITGFIPNLFYQ
jgi:tripartite ATP-independent transporter DctM subunit